METYVPASPDTYALFIDRLAVEAPDDYRGPAAPDDSLAQLIAGEVRGVQLIPVHALHARGDRVVPLFDAHRPPEMDGGHYRGLVRISGLEGIVCLLDIQEKIELKSLGLAA